MVAQRCDVALHEPQAYARVLVGAMIGLEIRHVIGREPADADEALAGEAKKISLAPDVLDDALEVAGLDRALAGAWPKHLVGDDIDARAGALQCVGKAIDQGFEKPEHDLLAIAAGHEIRLHRALRKGVERARLRIAHGDQRVVLEDEGDRGRAGFVRVEAHKRRHRHEFGATLIVEPGGDLDLLHFFTGRDRQAQMLFDEAVFGGRRIQQVDPRDQTFRHVVTCARVEVAWREAAVFPEIDTQHDRPRFDKASVAIAAQAVNPHLLSAMLRPELRGTDDSPQPLRKPLGHVLHAQRPRFSSRAPFPGDARTGARPSACLRRGQERDRARCAGPDRGCAPCVDLR